MEIPAIPFYSIEPILQSRDGARAARRYKRRFHPPLQTAADEFLERTGWLLREERDGERRFAEVAPFPGFVSDPPDWEMSIQRWLEGGESLGDEGALGFGGFCLQQSLPFPVAVDSAGLIDGRGGAASQESVVKVKIGMAGISEEKRRLESLLANGPPSTRIRLDANGQLDTFLTRQWLEWMEPREQIEFIEQPLPIGQEKDLREDFGEACIRIALDESVVVRRSFRETVESGWPGWWVLKPALFGSVAELFDLPEAIRRRIIISSAFETGIGFSHVLRVAGLLGGFGNFHGLGTRGRLMPEALDGWLPSNRFEGVVQTRDMEMIFGHDS